MFRSALVVTITFALGPAVPLALAQHEQHGGGKHGEEHGKPAQFKMPATYKEGVAEIQHRLHEIEELIASKELDQVHAQADVIQKVGNVLGQLALKRDSGVPKDAIKVVNKAGRELAAKFDAIDKAGDSGDLAGTRRVYEEMVSVTATLQKYVAKAFACPMKCEGGKTYSSPGTCPKCGMALKEVSPARGPHGGLIAWSGDQNCRVEATLSKDNEIRVYLCDEKSKPLSADRAAVQAHAGQEGAQHYSVTLAPDASKSFLRGRIAAAVKPPFLLMLKIDLGDSGKPQTVTIDFEAPTDMPHKEHEEQQGHKGDEHKGHRP
ncbi:MAG: hypothetical protein L6R00_17355 [Phycisphaerae bacterium]|nr:hypothetical protein [Phycisphaerae bacterium]